MTPPEYSGASTPNRTEAVHALTYHANTIHLLIRLARCSADSGLSLSSEVRWLRELSERLDTGRFHLAVLGQLKRGKTSLRNALLGESLLPISVVPQTAIPTFIQWGGALRLTGSLPSTMACSGSSAA